MQLKHWPITKDQATRFHYRGEAPDAFLWSVLSDVGDCIVSRTDGSNLAPELLDPYVFAQFVTGLQGKYTVNGMPFANNWRLMSCATRMAQRIGASDLARALKDGEAELATWDTADLDAHDQGLWRYNRPDEKAKAEKLSERFDMRFVPVVEAGDCSYGVSWKKHEGSERLLAALADWISEAMPREVVADQAAVDARLKANHTWACENVQNYEREYTSYYVGEDVFDMLKSMGRRFEHAVGRDFEKPHELQVIAREIFTDGGQALIEFRFGDGLLLADADTLIERQRRLYDKPLDRPAHLVRYLMLADAPSVALNMKTFETHAPSIFKPMSKTLKYKQ